MADQYIPIDPATQEWREKLGERLDNQDHQIVSVRGELLENTKTTRCIKRDVEKLKTDTSEMLEMFRSWQGAMKVLESIGKAAKPAAAIVGLLAALGAWWMSIKSIVGK